MLDGPFSGIIAATPAYGIRGLFGTTYEATDHTTLGGYWMTKQSLQFDDAILLQIGAGPPVFSSSQDISLDLPETFGIGVRDFFPGVDLDLNAGGMLDAQDYFGIPGSGSGASVESYWVSLDMTWRFGRGACERLPVPDRWCKHSDVGCGLR